MTTTRITEMSSLYKTKLPTFIVLTHRQLPALRDHLTNNLKMASERPLKTAPLCLADTVLYVATMVNTVAKKENYFCTPTGRIKLTNVCLVQTVASP